MFYGHTQEEWDQFTKTERRILALVHDLKYDQGEICRALEIKEPTMRFHLSRIRRKQSLFRTIRAKLSSKEDMARYKDKFLPEFDPDAIPKGNPKFVSIKMKKRQAEKDREFIDAHLPPELEAPAANSASLPAPNPSPFVHIPNPSNGSMLSVRSFS